MSKKRYNNCLHSKGDSREKALYKQPNDLGAAMKVLSTYTATGKGDNL